LDGVPEEQALDIILRSVPGYMAAPRTTIERDASIYDRILIMPTTVAVAPRPPAPAPQTPFQSFPQPGSGVTQLRSAPFIPGSLPDPVDNNGPDMNDPAIAAAAAAGLFAVPAPGPNGPLLVDPGLRSPLATTTR